MYHLGAKDFLRALHFSTVTGKLIGAGNSPGTFPYGSGSPVVTSNGTNPASAVVWVVNRSGAKSVFDAFTAIPTGGKLKPLWSAPIGTAAKFTAPATDNGRVYLGTADGKVFGYRVTVAATVLASRPSKAVAVVEALVPELAQAPGAVVTVEASGSGS